MHKISLHSKVQSAHLQRVEPPFWWVGMKDASLQIMFYGDNLSSYTISIINPLVSLRAVHRMKSPNYLFVDVLIAERDSEVSFEICFLQNGYLKFCYTYSLYQRSEASAQRKGFDSGDAIYLLMPDRFANGDPSIDNVPEMLETCNRRRAYGRHGGDLKGVIDHLDYIKELGFTALWLNPVLENNQTQSSYHGYAITDFYKVDSRLGSNQVYQQLALCCKENGIKLIKDLVFNHCGTGHWWMDDLPSADWINHWEHYTQSNHRLSTISDPYASKFDLKRTVDGWFDKTMPDLNLKNPFLLRYLIQNSIWWIEYAYLSGIRMDTYPYPDKEGMAVWAKRIKEISKL